MDGVCLGVFIANEYQLWFFLGMIVGLVLWHVLKWFFVCPKINKKG